MSASRRHPAVRTLLLLVALGLAGCGGGGGGRGPTAPPPPPPPAQSISFTPTRAAAPPAILIPATSANGAIALVLEIRAEDLVDLYGVSFDLEYPDAFVRWDEAATEQGDFLEDAELLIAEEAPGRLVVGLTRLGPVDGVTGSGLLLSLRFVAEADGSGAIAFVGEAAFASDGTPIGGVDWVGGTLEADI